MTGAANTATEEPSATTPSPLNDNLLEEQEGEGEEGGASGLEQEGAGLGKEPRLKTEMVAGARLAVNDLSVVTPTG